MKSIKNLFLGVALVLSIAAIWFPGLTTFMIQASTGLIILSCLIKNNER